MYTQEDIKGLKSRKKEMKWSNKRLAQESGIPVGTINKIFSGATRYPRNETMSAIMRAMGVKEHILSREDMPGASLLREKENYHPADEERRATLTTYYSLPGELRTELIDGKFYYMPAPSLEHQWILVEISAVFHEYFKGSTECRVLVTPCDVCLDHSDYTVLHPDIFVMKGREKYQNGMRCVGAPELVVEVVSSANAEHDYELKRYKYQNAGVKEYWIVDPEKERVIVYVFLKDALPLVYALDEVVKSYVYPGLEVDFGRMKSSV